MQFSAQELSDMVSRRQFQQVIDLWKKGKADDEQESLFQVFLAATMVKDDTLARLLRGMLPAEMAHDADRDLVLMRIRDRDVTDETIQQAMAVFGQAEELNDPQRLALANMMYARLNRAMGMYISWAVARRQINEALELMDEQGRSADEVWRRNVAFWYLVINGKGRLKLLALKFALTDPSWKKRLLARLCYLLPSIGRRLPMY